MGRSTRRAAQRVCLTAAAASLLLAASVNPSPAQEDPDVVPRPEVFRGAASSQVASVKVDREALLPIDDLFRFIALDGSATYESSTRQARASVLFPGNGVILGPSLACGTFGAQFPPELAPVLDTCLQYRYPLTVFADDFAPDGVSSGAIALGAPGDPVSGNAVRAGAHAGEDAATTDAAIQDLRVLGLPAFGPLTPLLGEGADTSLLNIDSATSRTDQRIEAGVLVVDATATLSGVEILAGLIDIGSIVSSSHVTDDGRGKRTAEASIEVGGVTVAGLPAQLTEEGLVLGEPTGALGPLLQPLQDQLTALLSDLAVRIDLLDIEETTDEAGGAVAAAGGLLFEVSVPVEGLPTVPGPTGEVDPNGSYSASIQLGSTAARGLAATFDSDPGSAEPPVVDDGGGFDAGLPSFDTGAPLDLAPTEVAVVPPAPSPGAERPATPTGPLEQVVDRFGGRLELVYLALALAVMGLCIAPRFTTPARLPGPAS